MTSFDLNSRRSDRCVVVSDSADMRHAHRDLHAAAAASPT